MESREISTATSIAVGAAIALILRYFRRTAPSRTTAPNAGEKMTANYGPEPTPPQPEYDKTVDQARMEFAADVRRLNQYHVITGWSIDPLTGSLIAVCGCDMRPRTTAGNHHWAQALRKARGPVDNKKK